MSKKRRSRVPTGLRRAYRALVGVSAVIVAVYAVWQIVIRPPAVAESPVIETQAVDPGVDVDHEAGDAQGRRENCYTILLVGTDDGNGNADTIMVVSYDVPAHIVNVVSIPRDTLVDVTRRVKKINAAYSIGGVDEVEREVEALLGIPIDYTCNADIKAFMALVDAVDGVEFYVPCDMDYDDPYQNLSIHYTEGTKTLTGQQAMEVARFRKNNDGSGYSDLGRVETQRGILTAVAKKVLSWSSMSRIKEFIGIFDSYVETNLSVTDMIWFATQAMSLDFSSDIHTMTLPGDGETKYLGINYYYGLYPDETLEMINLALNPYHADLTMEQTGIFSP